MTDRKKKKRIILAVFAGLVVFSILGSVFLFAGDSLASLFSADGQTAREKPVYSFYPPDFRSDVFSDADYLDTDRSVCYTEDGVSLYSSGDDFSSFGAEGAFLAEYFAAAVRGDVQYVNSCYSDDYISKNGEKAPFPMQRIYELVIEKKSVAFIEEGEYAGFVRSTFDVSYKIRKNDGLFDDDIPSDASRKRLYELLSGPSGIRINSVSEYNLK